MPCPNAMLGTALPITRAFSFHLKCEIFNLKFHTGKTCDPRARTRATFRGAFPASL